MVKAETGLEPVMATCKNAALPTWLLRHKDERSVEVRASAGLLFSMNAGSLSQNCDLVSSRFHLHSRIFATII